MAGAKKTIKAKRKIRAYTHEDKLRLNNPPVGLVTPDTDKDAPKKTYAYDPHLEPSLQWAGKAENTSFEVPTVSLHMHERIDPYTIIQAVKKKNGDIKGNGQFSLFEQQEVPLREAIEFYKHKSGWSNRLIAGDSLLVMNSLLEKEGVAGQVQMVYVDPPYGIKYKSNFQPFTNNNKVAENDRDEDLTAEPETLKAFRDTWELGIHSYLSYLKDRLFVAKDLLADSGSCFVQISDENLHYVRNIMDEVFSVSNFIALIAFKKKKMPLGETHIFTMCDYIIWYAKDKTKAKFHRLYIDRKIGDDSDFNYIELQSGKTDTIANYLKNNSSIPKDARYFQSMDMRSSGRTDSCVFEYKFESRSFFPSGGKSWKTNLNGMKRLDELNRLFAPGDSLRYKFFFEDYPVTELSHMWMDTQGATDMKYVVQTTEKAVQRCMLMCTDPGDLVFDPTCGGGTTAYVAEQWGRRWITCDTSRVALTLTKQRLMTATFNYYELSHPQEGVGSGFRYKSAPHITLGSLANNETSAPVVLYDQPCIDQTKVRVTGPFTVEAVPSPVVRSLDNVNDAPANDTSIVRSGETLRQTEWGDELFKTGIRGKSGQCILFSRVESLAGTRYLHADAETKEDKPQRTVISFGPDYAPLEQRQVALAIEEAQALVPKPKIIVFAAFQFDPEAAKDVDETNWPGVTLLKVQMNADLLTEDLKKKRSSNESFWLIGQPDVELKKNKNGTWQVVVLGFDYYNTKTGLLESGGSDKIAMWMLDNDYDGRSLFPHQVFFPISSEKEGWSKLAKNLKAEIDEEKIEAYSGTLSLPFTPGGNHRIAVKIIDDRGIESLKILKIT